jgi:FkbM family methyltransferase
MWMRALRALTRRYPFQTPRASLVGRLPDVPAGFGPFGTKGAIRLRAYTSGTDLVVKNMFWFGDFDPWVGRTLARLARPGDVICDIGANIGDTALSLARKVGPAGHVYAFEPVPAVRDCLIENARANGLTNVTVVGAAVSDMRGEVNFGVPEEQPGMAGVCDGVGAISVPALPFDDWLASVPVERVAVCKIDVEGHEEAVFRGMRKSLADRRISSFVFERHTDAAVGDRVIDLLVGHGYSVRQIHKRLRAIVYSEIGKRSRGAKTADFVAVLPGTEAAARLASRR